MQSPMIPVRLTGICLLFLLLLGPVLHSNSNPLVVIDDYDKEYVAQLNQHIKTWEEHSFPCKIEQGLYLGSYTAASNKTALQSVNITHVLTVAHALPSLHPDDFVYKVIQIPDLPDAKLSEYFDECFKFIDDAIADGGAVMVHCFAGVSRSATVTVAYMMYKYNMSLIEAFTHVLARRPVIHPNSGFIQLKEYEIYLQGQRDEL